MNKLDLTIKGLNRGTHEEPWDLEILLYKNAAKVRRTAVMSMIQAGELGSIDECRLPFILKLHDYFLNLVAKGSSQATVKTYLERLWLFYAWADSEDLTINEDSVISVFQKWTEFLLFRINIAKDIKHYTAFKTASLIANIIAVSLDLPGKKPGNSLMLMTRLKRPKSSSQSFSLKADKQNLSDTFKFGKALTTICNELDVSTVRGPLPIRIKIDEEHAITLLGNIMSPDVDLTQVEDNAIRETMTEARRAMYDHESLFDSHKRSAIVNTRIECELLIFIAQTGMNVSQASKLDKSSFRWQSVGNEYDVFQVYKGRREGSAIFRCYSLYREHFNRYLKWLDETGLSDISSKLFPVYSRSIIKARGSNVDFNRTRRLFKKHDLDFVNPSALRKTRVNWLLRETDSIELTADHMGHTPNVLLQNYMKPNHQRAVSEITRFHSATDPNYQASPGPGLCVNTNEPTPISSVEKQAPLPDCISPEGCLFCTNHRDIMEYDYCWKLASHSKIKTLEVNLYKPSINNDIHPANIVIDRISKKLSAISSSSEIRRVWVQDAYDSVRSGVYHPRWDVFIQLMESN